MFRIRILALLLGLLALVGCLAVLGSREPLPEPCPADQTQGPDWRLALVNPWTPMEADYVPELTQLGNGQAVDCRIAHDLQAMLEACQAAGLSPLICSSYRTWEKQETLYQALVDKRMAQGYALEDARTSAAREVAVPGTSEHQLGLAVDIVDLSHQVLDESQESTAVQQWLLAHSWEYGFILRYPSDKSQQTGIIYEPWHYRYVGHEAARAITQQGLCLEEYLAQS